MGALVQQTSIIGTTANTRTENFSAAVAGNILILVAVVNENNGTDNINAPTGGLYTLLGTFRQGTIDVNIAVYGKVATGGETSVTITSSASQRFQTWFGEFSGYTLTLDGSISTAGASTSVSAGDTGTVTPSAAGRLYLGVVAVKNSEAALTEVGGFSVATVTNEVGAASTQKVTVGVYYDLARSTAAREQPTWATITARYGGMGLLLTPTVTTRRYVVFC